MCCAACAVVSKLLVVLQVIWYLEDGFCCWCDGSARLAECVGVITFYHSHTVMCMRPGLISQPSTSIEGLTLCRFITQRQEAEMALIKPSLDPFSQMLTLEAPGMPPCKVPPTREGFRYSVGVWDDTLLAVDQGIEAEEWISSYLSIGPIPTPAVNALISIHRILSLTYLSIEHS
jgi:hypothetical protein